MRKLLVASQQSGVGKTTTSINLAAATAMGGSKVLLLEADSLGTINSYLKLDDHPKRQSLRQMEIDLPGAVCTDVIPNLDVICPYDGGRCTDGDLEQVLHMLADGALQVGYDCLVVNAPPFLGGRPEPFLETCSEFVLVMQAEPLAYRTMPAFLRLMQQSTLGQPSRIAMKGILLTLPEGEAVGGPCERELRGRFGSMVMPQVVPYDEEVTKAEMFGHVLVHVSVMAPAALAYQGVVAQVELTEKAARAESRSARSALVMAATAARINEAASRPAKKKRAQATIVTAVPPLPSTPRQPARRRPRPGIPQVRRFDSGESHSQQPRETDRLPAGAAPVPAPHPRAPGFDGRPAPSDAAQSLQAKVLWIVVIGVAIAFGAGIRFVQIPPNVMPILVGVGVTLAAALVLRQASQQSGEFPSHGVAGAGPGRKPATQPQIHPNGGH